MQRKIYITTALGAALTLPAAAYGQTTPDERQAILAAHNVDRDLHCVPRLQWSDHLAANAQAWANGCRFAHQPNNPNGENLSAGYREANGQPLLPGQGPEQAVQGWYSEISEYDFNNPILLLGPGPVNGHFTQVVWRASTQLGCAQATCQIPTRNGTTKLGTLWVCEYSPQGNFNATPDTLRQNVPSLCN